MTAAAGALLLDKSLPYRIGPSFYAQYLWVGRLAIVSLAVGVITVVLGIVFRRRLPIVLGLLTPAFLVYIGGVHSGPNAFAWCINNFRQIDGAKEQLAFADKLTNEVAVTAEQVSPHIKDGFGSLECAEHGKYTINPIGTEPRCSFHGSISEMETRASPR